MPAQSLTPKELVYKHIFDKSHIVTEEELQNVRVGFLYNENEKHKPAVTGERLQVNLSRHSTIAELIK